MVTVGVARTGVRARRPEWRWTIRIDCFKVVSVHRKIRAAACLWGCVVALGPLSGTAGAAAPPPVAVLEPAQERAVSRLLGTDRVDLGDGVTIDDLALLPDRIELTVLAGGAPLTVTLWPPGTERAGMINTPAGALAGASGLPGEATRELVRRLSAPDAPPLRWRSLVMEVDRALAERQAAAVATAMAGGPSPRAPPALVAEAVEAVQRGDGELAAAALRGSLCGRRAPPPGAVSTWLAAGGEAEALGSAECPAREVSSALDRDRLGSQALARWADEPRILVTAARLAAEAGESARAAALLKQALAAPVRDLSAQRLATGWGWALGGRDGPSLPAVAEVQGEPAPPWPWLWLSGALLALALSGVLVREGPISPRLALGAGVILGAAVLAVLSQPGAGSELRVPDPGAPVADWLALGRGTACVVSAPAVTDSSWQALVRCPDGDAGVAVVGGVEDEGSLYERTGAHSLTLMPFDSGGQVGPELERWIRRVLTDVYRLEAAGLALSVPAPTEVGTRRGPRAGVWERVAARPLWQRAGLAASGVVAAVALPCLLLLLWFALRDLASVTSRRWRWAMAATLAATVVAHLLAPGRMVMVYSGYTQTSALIAWEPLRYGAGANWLYGPWLDWLGWDHASVQTLNRLFGVAGTVLLAGLVGKLSPRRPVAALATLLFIGTAPIMWRDHASESILVGGWVMLAAALYGIAAAAQRPTVGLLAGPCALLAAVTRPELALAVGPLGLLVLLQLRPAWSRRTWAGVGVVSAAAALVAVPHIAFVQEMLDFLRRTGALPGLAGLGDRMASELFGLSGFTVATRYGPILLVAFIPPALLLARGRRLTAAGVLLVALAWTAFTRVDLPEVSTPRVHAPPWTLFAIVAAIGADALLVTAGKRLSVRGRWGLGALLVCAWLTSAAGSV